MIDMTDRSEPKRRLQSGRQTTADQKRKEEYGSRDNRSNQVTFAMDTVRVSTLDTSRDTSDVLLADPERMEVALSINGHPVQLECDTGAAVTFVNETTWASMDKPNLRRSLVRCHDFNGNEIMVKGQTFVQVCYDDGNDAVAESTDGNDAVAESTDGNDAVAESTDGNDAVAESTDYLLYEVNDDLPQDAFASPAESTVKGEDDGNDAVAESADDKAADDLFYEVNDDLLQAAFASSAELTVPDTSQDQQLLPRKSTRERRLPRDRPPLRYES
uniref:Uncharacterized protein n=1 Tax=Plectus sambesii TaxID=2011161 RepID=A0A914UWC5_9BILA